MAPVLLAAAEADVTGYDGRDGGSRQTDLPDGKRSLVLFLLFSRRIFNLAFLCVDRRRRQSPALPVCCFLHVILCTDLQLNCGINVAVVFISVING